MTFEEYNQVAQCFLNSFKMVSVGGQIVKTINMVIPDGFPLADISKQSTAAET